MAALQQQQQHFVFVHGGGHGAWCWFKLRPLLQNFGHKVSCLDLTGAGINLTDPNTIANFDEYNEPLTHFMSSLSTNEKVVLVGHSVGGLSLTYAFNKFADKISVAIYLAAAMVQPGTEGHTPFGFPDLSKYQFYYGNGPENPPTNMKLKEEFGGEKLYHMSPDEWSPDEYEFYFGDGLDHPPTSMKLKEEFQREKLYHMSPVEDSILASMLLRPSSFRGLMPPISQPGEAINKVRKVYIKTMHDRMAKLEKQENMIREWPPSEVMTIETDHSPFFSAPEELCNLLLKASASI